MVKLLRLVMKSFMLEARTAALAYIVVFLLEFGVYSNGSQRAVVKPYSVTPYYLYNGEYQDYVQIMNQVITNKYPYGLNWGTPEYKEAYDAYYKQQRELTDLIKTLERQDRPSLQSARVLELNRVFKFVP